MKSSLCKFILLFIVLFSLKQVSGQVVLPRLISDGMILQRNAEVKIWGWASPGEKVSLQFIDSVYTTNANSKGDWQIILNDLKPSGPFKMSITASNSITIDDILVGDVWLCSGQSNMELPMKRVSPIYQNEIANCDNDKIRQFVVPQKYNFNYPEKDLSGGSWKKASKSNIYEFSAVAYFYAKELYNVYKIPIGIINASLGGSPAEAWISEESLKKFPQYYNEALKFRDSLLIKKIESTDRQNSKNWYQLLWEKDFGYDNPEKIWYSPKLNTNDWSTMKIPGYWAKTSLGPVNGVVWFRKEFYLSGSKAGLPAKLNLGRIVDADSVFVNGVFVGSTSYQYPPRRYEIPAGVLKKGHNNITVRVISNKGNGGFVPDKPYQLIIGKKIIDLKGNWYYALGATMEPLADQTFIRWKPMGLFNAMINPLLNYRIKGAVWYQGESNADRPGEYQELLSTLIKDWRSAWKQGDFPFLFVQLANFMEAKKLPSESNWAQLRESQLKTLALPKTGMAVIIDIGEWNDIHPLNKKDVGIRLALAAQKIAYNNDSIVYSGPIFKSMKIVDNKIELTFDNIGSGLVAEKSKKLHQFALAGEDRKFYWAKAKIVNNKVIVWDEKVKNPVAVRYAWADNPEKANLYNLEGLPASPFRTDNWTTH